METKTMVAADESVIDGLTSRMSGGIGEIVIDRPARRNALTFAMWNGLADLVEEMSSRPDARVIVLRGEGGHFSAGADIGEFDSLRGDAAGARRYEAANSRAFAAVRMAPVPVITAIRGICFGGGFGLAAAADLRLATPDALFAVPAARLGLAYPQDAMIDIVSSTGPQMARYLAFTGARITASDALACGFLLEISDADALDARVSEIARGIAANAPLSVRASKLSIAAAVTGDRDAARMAQETGDLTFESPDYAEGRAAFRDKRPPRFTGEAPRKDS